MSKFRYLNSVVCLCVVVFCATTSGGYAQDATASRTPVSAAGGESQERLVRLFRQKTSNADAEIAARAAREFIEQLRQASPITAEKLAAGKMDDEELDSRFGIFLLSRPHLSGKTAEHGAETPRVRVAAFLKDSPKSGTEPERLVLADRFLERLGERSPAARASLLEARMTNEELQSRVAVFISDLNAETAAPPVDPAVAAVAALVDSFVKANFGGATERAAAVTYKGTTEEKGVKREFVVFKKKPAKFRMHIMEAGLVVSVIGFDGKNAWQQSLAKPAVRIVGSEAEMVAGMARFDAALVDYQDRGAQVLREDKPGNGPIALRIKEPNGTEAVSMIDPVSLNELSVRSRGLGGIEEETRFRDYRKIGVLNVAHVHEQWSQGALRSTTIITEVGLDPGLFDEFFVRPESQTLGFMDYMGALSVVQTREKRAATNVNGDKP